MSHSSGNKPGPTLQDCEWQGITHLRVTCKNVDCRHEHVFAVQGLRARRDVPVNYIRWKCDKANGGCGRAGEMFVNAIYGEPEAPAHPIFDLKDVRAKPRRYPIMIVRKNRQE